MATTAFTKSFGKSTIVTFKNISGKEFVQIIVVQNTTHHNYYEIIRINLKILQANSITTAENLCLKKLRLSVSNFVTLISSWFLRCRPCTSQTNKLWHDQANTKVVNLSKSMEKVFTCILRFIEFLILSKKCENSLSSSCVQKSKFLLFNFNTNRVFASQHPNIDFIYLSDF